MAGWNEVALGNSGDALELFRRAERFSPRDPKGWYIAVGVGHCHYIEGRFKDAATWTQKAVVQNPRSGVSLRYHAASLAKLGQIERASKFMQDVLANEPQLTVSRLRARTMFMDEGAWLKYADGLRLAGMPE
jgi:tetratricopeptide (TPR) repeat protein